MKKTKESLDKIHDLMDESEVLTKENIDLLNQTIDSRSEAAFDNLIKAIRHNSYAAGGDPVPMQNLIAKKIVHIQELSDKILKSPNQKLKHKSYKNLIHLLNN